MIEANLKIITTGIYMVNDAIINNKMDDEIIEIDISKSSIKFSSSFNPRISAEGSIQCHCYYDSEDPIEPHTFRVVDIPYFRILELSVDKLIISIVTKNQSRFRKLKGIAK